jgi:hypothetical protein
MPRHYGPTNVGPVSPAARGDYGLLKLTPTQHRPRSIRRRPAPRMSFWDRQAKSVQRFASELTTRPLTADFRASRVFGTPTGSGRAREIVASASADERHARIGRRSARSPVSIAGISRFRLPISTRVEQPPDDDEDGEEVRQSHEEIHRHGLLLPGQHTRSTRRPSRFFATKCLHAVAL